jgi:sialic acid synthase
MAGEKGTDDAINVITKHHNDLSILHCVSQYPTVELKYCLKASNI